MNLKNEGMVRAILQFSKRGYQFKRKSERIGQNSLKDFAGLYSIINNRLRLMTGGL